MMQKHSQEIQTKALQVAKSIQKPSQTKEQTKLIAQGIEKGIAEYKKQQSKKSRERDKAKKLLSKEKNKMEQLSKLNIEDEEAKTSVVPWSLLVMSWVGFIVYFVVSQ